MSKTIILRRPPPTTDPLYWNSHLSGLTGQYLGDVAETHQTWDGVVYQEFGRFPRVEILARTGCRLVAISWRLLRGRPVLPWIEDLHRYWVVLQTIQARRIEKSRPGCSILSEGR